MWIGERGGVNVFSPKGWDTLARGNAPGYGVIVLQPEGLRYVSISQAFSLEDKYDRVPGALPRAKVSQLFGLKTFAPRRAHPAREKLAAFRARK